MRVQHVANVVDNMDPEKRGRIKVSCASLCGSDPSSGEPRVHPAWIDPQFSVMLTEDGKVSTSGFFAVPNVGSTVVISVNDSSSSDRSPFESSILSSDPRWEASLLRVGDQLSETFTKNYPLRLGLRSATGHVLMMDDTESPSEHRVLLANGGEAKDGSGCYVSLGGDGSVVIGTPSGHLVFLDDPNQAITILDPNSNMISLQSQNITIAEGSKGSMIHLGPNGVTVSTPEAVNVTANDVSLSAGSVHLGQSAVEAVIKGNTFQALFNAHIHPTGVGPSGPPAVPLTGAELSLVSKTE